MNGGKGNPAAILFSAAPRVRTPDTPPARHPLRQCLPFIGVARRHAAPSRRPVPRPRPLHLPAAQLLSVTNIPARSALKVCSSSLRPPAQRTGPGRRFAALPRHGASAASAVRARITSPPGARPMPAFARSGRSCKVLSQDCLKESLLMMSCPDHDSPPHRAPYPPETGPSAEPARPAVTTAAASRPAPHRRARPRPGAARRPGPAAAGSAHPPTARFRPPEP